MADKPKYPNREAWLSYVTERLAPMFVDAGAQLPPKIRIAIGFPSAGRKGKVVGECWDGAASDDGAFEILIRPNQAEPVEVVDTLVHELIHAAAGIEEGHKGEFKRVARVLGMSGKLTSCGMGDALRDRVLPILRDAGPFPHAKLNEGGLTTRPTKQTARMVKCWCEECGYVVRSTRKWIIEKGAPSCPEHGEMSTDLPVEDEPEPVDGGAEAGDEGDEEAEDGPAEDVEKWRRLVRIAKRLLRSVEPAPEDLADYKKVMGA
ncbi:MAG TPA: transcription elongation protein SprT [Rhizomicrobium sp.]|nr:transcription elongation protein SprT [Rhizomicrobium sp.]